MKIKQNESCIKLKVFLSVSLISIVIWTCSVARSAPGQKSGEEFTGQISFFDPFDLQFVCMDVTGKKQDMPFLANKMAQHQAVGSKGKPDATVSSSNIIRRCPIRIPYRPPCRSPFRPPWVPGPPPWYPGPPPWNPGPPPWNP